MRSDADAAVLELAKGALLDAATHSTLFFFFFFFLLFYFIFIIIFFFSF